VKNVCHLKFAQRQRSKKGIARRRKREINFSVEVKKKK
jgi:hypothetical protein